MIKSHHLKDAIICSTQDSVVEVAKILRDTLSHSVIVVNSSHEPVGVVSNSDIVNRCIASQSNCDNVKAQDIMTKEIVIVELTSPINEIKKTLDNIHAHTLPVTNKGKLVGIIDTWTLLRVIHEEEEE